MMSYYSGSADMQVGIAAPKSLTVHFWQQGDHAAGKDGLCDDATADGKGGLTTEEAQDRTAASADKVRKVRQHCTIIPCLKGAPIELA